MFKTHSSKVLFTIAFALLAITLSACSLNNPDARRLERLDKAISDSSFQTAEKLISTLEKSQNPDTIKHLEKAKEKLKQKKIEQAELEEAVRKEIEKEQAEYDKFENDFSTVASQNNRYHFLYQDCDVKEYYTKLTLYVNDGWNLLTHDDKVDFAARMIKLYKGMLGARNLYSPNMKINFYITDVNSRTMLASGDTKSNTITIQK